MKERLSRAFFLFAELVENAVGPEQSEWVEGPERSEGLELR